MPFFFHESASIQPRRSLLEFLGNRGSEWECQSACQGCESHAHSRPFTPLVLFGLPLPQPCAAQIEDLPTALLVGGGDGVGGLGHIAKARGLAPN